MVGSLETVSTGKNVCKLRGIMDQNRKMLGADPKIRILVAEGNQGDFLRLPLTYQTSRAVVGHGHLISVLKPLERREEE